MSNMPVDLIIQDCLHKLAGGIEKGIPGSILARAMTAADVAREARSLTGLEATARALLYKIANDASLPRVLAALAAVGGPKDLATLDAMLAGVLEARRLDATGDLGAARPLAHPAAPAKPATGGAA